MKGNNVLKQLSKILLSVCLVFAFLCTPITKMFSKIVNVFASNEPELSDIEGKNVQVVGFESTGTVGEPVKLPNVYVGGTLYTALSNNNDVHYVVKTPAGKSTVTVNAESLNGGFYYFTPDKVGVYTIDVYTSFDGELSTVVENLQINVAKAKVEMTVSNSIATATSNAYVLPAKIYHGDLVGENFKLPAPTLSEDADIANVRVSIIPSGVGATAIELDYDSTGNFYYLGTAAKNTLNAKVSYGTYTVKYSYYANGVKLGSDITLTTEVTNNEDFKDDIKLAISTLVSSTELATGEVGETINLPTATIYNSASGTTDSVPAIISISVTNPNNANVEVQGYTFKADKKGIYTITYTAKYPYTNQTVEKNFTIELVDETDPEVMLVDEYDLGAIKQIDGVTTEDDVVEYLRENKDASDMIKSVYVLSGTGEDLSVKIDIPAIYAKDNAAETNYTFSRYLTTANNSKVEIEEETHKTTSYTAKSEGVYTFFFSVTDANGNNTLAKKSVLVVSENTLLSCAGSGVTVLEDITKPTITTGTLPRSIDSDGILTFAMPTATDALTSAFKSKFTKLKSSSISWASNVEITTTITAYDSSNQQVGTPYVLSDANIDEDTNKYAIDMAEVFSANMNSIAYIEVSYSASTDWMKDLQLTNATKEPSKINYVYVQEDTTASTIEAVEFVYDSNGAVTTYNTGLLTALNNKNSATIQAVTGKTTIGANGLVDMGDGTYKAPFNQYSSTNNPAKVKFPDVIVTDTEDATNLSVTGTITDSLGNTKNFLPKFVKVVNGAVNQYYVELGEHELTVAGMYTVTVTAVDKGGNISTYSFAIMVNDNTSPSDVVLDVDVVGDSTISKTYNTGEFIYFPDATIEDNTDENCTYTVELTSAPANARVIENKYNTGFKTLTAGSYKITYTCSDASGNTFTKVYTLEVVAKDNTSIIVNEEAFEEDDMRYDFVTEGTTMKIVIPYATTINAEDSEKNNIELTPEKGITVKNSSGVTQTVVADGENWSFNAKQGKYTIEYKYGTTTKSYTIFVGDTDAPVLTWLQDAPTSLKVGDTWGKDITTMFKITDVVNGETKDITYDSIIVTSPDGKTKTPLDGTKDMTFSAEGDYTLTIKYTDGVNAQEEKITIKVSSETTEPTTNTTNVVGTILLIASILVVGGVIVYLILSSKKSKKKN